MPEINDRPRGRRPGKPAAGAPAAVTPRPAEGGSYVRKSDGSWERREWTRQLDDPSHELNQAPAAEPGAEAGKE